MFQIVSIQSTFQVREGQGDIEDGSDVKVQPFGDASDLDKFFATEEVLDVFASFKKPLRRRALDHLLTPIAPVANADPDFGVTLEGSQE